MNYLSVENLTKTYGERTIFEDLNFGIAQGQKVALVAKNGTGKTTLLRCLMGEEPYDTGRIVFNNDIRVAFLQQADELNAENTIFEEILNHDLPKLNVFKQYSKAVREQDDEKIAALYEKVSEQNAWNLDSLIEQILSKLKLKHTEAKISTLSGGQRKRVAIAKVLITEPDFLFLDEPTNHLDLDMIEWLEAYLSQSKATLFMVTHDRYFLEVVANEILELDKQQLHQYKGNYSFFLEKKAEREENFVSEVNKARNQYRKELKWIKKQPKARGTKQKSRVDAFDDIESKAKQNLKKEKLDIPIKMQRLGTKIVELHNVSKSYSNEQLLDQLSYNIKRQERLGIVGANGVGKSTLLKIITGKESADQGKVVIGETVVFGYYSQENIQVDENKKVIEVIRDIAEYIPLYKGKVLSAAQFLERFLFPRKMHYQYVYKLSGGEKRRLKLMTVLMSNPNFLILDEPTNDLDIYILNVLEDYLKSFEGCLIVVSHDRYFMDKMVDHLFVFEGEGKIKDIIGNYTAYREKQKQEKKLQQQQKAADKPKKQTKKNTPAKPQEKKKLSYKEQIEFEKLDKEIVTLEEQKEEVSAMLMSGKADSEELNQAGIDLAQITTGIEEKTKRWMYLADFVK